MLRIAICDDLDEHLRIAKKMISDFLQEEHLPSEILLFHSGEEFLSEIAKNDYQPDIAVLDIEMDGKDGITLAGELNHSVPFCRIIFLTGYIDYAPDAYHAEHIWFVVKKRAHEHLVPALKKALRSLEDSESSIPAISIRSEGKTVAVPLDTILYISKVGRKAYICCAAEEYYDTRRPALLIPDHLKNRFIQCHQGYWVNSKYIHELDHEEFILTDGTRIPISRTFRTQARAQFFAMFRYGKGE